MQKVITVTATTAGTDQVKEHEYPQLNEYLEQGYYVIKTYPKFSEKLQSYSITFILSD